MNLDWTSLLIGLILGWLLEWIIDWLYWRKGRVDAGDLAAMQEKLDAADNQVVELEASLASLQTDLNECQANYDDLQAENALLETVRADLTQCQTNYADLEAENALLQSDIGDLQLMADEARIRAIGRLTAIEGIDEDDAGLLYEAGITSSDDLLITDDSVLQATLGLGDAEYDGWSAQVKTGLAALGLGLAASQIMEDDEADARLAAIDVGLEDDDDFEIEGDLIVEEVLETYDFDDDGNVDLVVETTIEGLDIDGDGEIDIVLEELIEADILDEDAVSAAEAELDAEIDAELEALDGIEVGDGIEAIIEEAEQDEGIDPLRAVAAIGAVEAIREFEAEEEIDELEALDALEDDVAIDAVRLAAVMDLASSPDDLTKIQGIGPRFSEKLNDYGIMTYAALAASTNEELDAAIEPKNWQKVDYDGWRLQALAYAETPLPQIAGDDLKQIEGIGPKYSELLREADILTFAELADSEPERLAEIIGAPAWRKVDYDSWIMQAGLAAAGDQEGLSVLQEELNKPEENKLILIHGLGDNYAGALVAAGIVTFDDLSAQTPEQLDGIISAAGLRKADYESWIAEAKLRAAGKRVASTSPRTRSYDSEVIYSCPQDLESIEGIGIVYERRLYEAAVGSYWEVAQLSDEELSDILEIMPFQDVNMAEIRASAMTLAVETETVNRVWDGTQPDDFEPLEGIGVIYERRLYNAGYCTYEALASATPEELEAICQPPSFQKPEFANWIATALRLTAAKGASDA